MEVGALTDACIKWASSTYLPQTSPPSMEIYIYRPDLRLVWPIVMKTKTTASSPQVPMGGLQVVTVCDEKMSLVFPSTVVLFVVVIV